MKWPALQVHCGESKFQRAMVVFGFAVCLVGPGSEAERPHWRWVRGGFGVDSDGVSGVGDDAQGGQS